MATRCAGAASTWMNLMMQKIDKECGPAFVVWSEFCDAFIATFESITNTEEVRLRLRNLK